MSSAATLQISTFGKYELLEYLGGGMADVYRARDKNIGKIVAVKILKPEHAANAEVKARFLEEARTAAALDHPHIINVFDFGVAEDGRSYIVMEFLRGQDLRGLIKNAAAIPIGDKLRLALQIAETLEYTHSQGVVHRDIKPENIHLNADGIVRLIDFGIAKSDTATLKTQAGFVLGTVFYMAPEQVRGHATKLVDIYAFGLLLYEMLTGTRAVNGATHEQVFYCILNQALNLDPLQLLGVPQSVQDLICHCTAKEPSNRPQSFAAVSNVLKEIIAELPAALSTQTMQVTREHKKPLGWRTYALIAFAVVLIGGVGAFIAISRGTNPRVESLHPEKPASTVSTAAPKLNSIFHPSGEMVLVPAGEFKFGEHKETRSLPDFYIDKTEVTNRAYSHVVPTKRSARNAEYPVVNVTVQEARSFCEEVGKRLPTMYEWEKAARGTDGREYPWGNQPDATRANVRDNPKLRSHKLMPADSFREGASPYGLLNMAGNVWEFVSDTRLPTALESKVFKSTSALPIMYGGSFNQNVDGDHNVKSWDNAIVDANYRDSDAGFRCAKSP